MTWPPAGAITSRRPGRWSRRGALVSGADYAQAQRVRRVAQQALGDLFGEVDLIATPTVHTGGLTYEGLAERGIAGRSGLMGLVNTGYWDCTGHPVLALPIGFTGDGMPLSMQLVAPPFGEAAALRAGQAYHYSSSSSRQPMTIGHCRRPDTIHAPSPSAAAFALYWAVATTRPLNSAVMESSSIRAPIGDLTFGSEAPKASDKPSDNSPG